MALRRFDAALAADAMAVHHVELSHACWLTQTPEGGLRGCAVGALYFAHYGDVPPDHTHVIDWAVDVTGSRTYVQGFDAGFHDFAQAEEPTHEYTLGLADGQLTRLLVDEPTACRPALWCWTEQGEATDGTTSTPALACRPRARG